MCSCNVRLFIFTRHVSEWRRHGNPFLFCSTARAGEGGKLNRKPCNSPILVHAKKRAFSCLPCICSTACAKQRQNTIERSDPYVHDEWFDWHACIPFHLRASAYMSVSLHGSATLNYLWVWCTTCAAQIRTPSTIRSYQEIRPATEWSTRWKTFRANESATAARNHSWLVGPCSWLNLRAHNRNAAAL